MERPKTSHADISTSDKSEALISLLDEYIDNLEKENKELKELNKSLIAFIEEESAPIWATTSDKFTAWHRKVELLTQNDK